jgi:hypothetical protein
MLWGRDFHIRLFHQESSLQLASLKAKNMEAFQEECVRERQQSMSVELKLQFHNAPTKTRTSKSCKKCSVSLHLSLIHIKSKGNRKLSSDLLNYDAVWNVGELLSVGGTYCFHIQG